MTARLVAHLAVLGRALRDALVWRILLLWTLTLLLPTAIAALPLWRELGSLLDHSPRALDFAHRFDMLVFQDLAVGLSRAEPALMGAGGLGTATALVLSPWLTGLMMGAANRERSARAGTLVQNGIAWYGRALRIWLVSLLPLIALGILGSMLLKTADDYGERAILESRAVGMSRAVTALIAIVFVLVHAVVELARAELVADPELRSAFRALARGALRAAQHPLAVLSFYLATTVASLLAAAILLLARIHIGGGSAFGLSGGFLVTQLAVACIGWGKLGRLFALTALARSNEEATRLYGKKDTPMLA